MKNLVKSFDNLPLIIKLILCLPVLNLAWAIYRICKGGSENRPLVLIAGIFWIFLGTTILWIVDLICTIIWKKPTVFA
jgi:hypothetical protein